MERFNKATKPYFLWLDLNKLFYQSLLIFLGGIILFLIILIKSINYNLRIDFLIYFYTIFVTAFQLSRIGGAMLYNYSVSKTELDNQEKYEPMVSFVIPCKNEEKFIARTVSKCFEADYPKDKLEVIVINDGSTDNTINILRSLKSRFRNFIIIDWEQNKGKRHGMHSGFKIARGEIVVQLDSDSYISPKTFRNLIRPFQNPEIGAVCAHSNPENADKNILTKMQAAYYFMSFRVLKAAESIFMSVFCCSGCSSAYRKSVVLPILDEWLGETFLGLPVTWGEDRALTNRVLKAGYKTIYSDKVQAHTVCPEDFRIFLKQQIRWKKGWFINSLFASRFIYKQRPFVAFTYFFPLILVTLITPFMVTKALIYNPLFLGIIPIFYVIGVFLVACIVVLYYKYLARDNKYWPYVFVWSSINMVVLSFILFYALFDIQNRKWGTR